MLQQSLAVAGANNLHEQDKASHLKSVLNESINEDSFDTFAEENVLHESHVHLPKYKVVWEDGTVQLAERQSTGGEKDKEQSSKVPPHDTVTSTDESSTSVPNVDICAVVDTDMLDKKVSDNHHSIVHVFDLQP